MIIITGGNGFIGKNFPDYSVFKISRQDVDLLDLPLTIKFFASLKDKGATKLIHTAGKIGGILGNRREKGTYYYLNSQINLNVLEACRQVDIKNVLSFSSSCAYPVNAPMPYLEQDFHNGMPHFDHYGYAFAKRMLDIQSRTYNEQFGTNFKVAILSNVYGPLDHYSNEAGHVVPSLIYKCALAKKYNKPFYVWGSGNPRRDLLYVNDVVNVSLALLNNKNCPSLINIGSPTETSIKELAILIAKNFEFTGDIVYSNPELEGQDKKPININKLTSILPNLLFTSVEDGIRQTIQHFLNNEWRNI